MKSEFWANGYADCQDGFPTNPYPEGTAAHDEWQAGYIQAIKDGLQG